MPSVLQTNELRIGYDAPRRPPIIVADSLNLTLSRGELVCLIGPNGAGKSTLLRTLAGMQTPLSGEVTLLGDDVHRVSQMSRAQRLSIVLTDRPDTGYLTGYELVALGRHPYTGWAGSLSDHDEAIIRWAVESVGAVTIATQPVNELSDGQRQKIMIARALAQEPDVILLDEPTAFLDLPRRVEIMQVLKQLAHTSGQAVLLSTHDLDLALRTSDRIWLMSQESDPRMMMGAPEDLVLNGAFSRAFQSEGVIFDPFTGAFKLRQPNHARISVHSIQSEASLPHIWTVRALERAGFIVEPDAELTVMLTQLDQHTHWTVSSDNQTYPSLQALVNALRAKIETVVTE